MVFDLVAQVATHEPIRGPAWKLADPASVAGPLRLGLVLELSRVNSRAVGEVPAKITMYDQ